MTSSSHAFGNDAIIRVSVMVLETLTGARPFAGATPEHVLTALLRSEYHLPGASAEMRALDAIVQRCRAKDPRDRYVSASELAAELGPGLARYEGRRTHQGVAGPDGSMVITGDA
jgi:serine/threonine protein kinase